MSRRFLQLLALGFTALAGFAQSPAPDANAQSGSAVEPRVSAFRGLFDVDLPTVDPPGTVKLILHPHFGDLLRRDYFRVEAGFRWAFNPQFEFRAEATTYFTHGLGDSGDGYGIGEVRLGTKYVFKEWLRPDYETSLVFNVELPTGSPPFDLTDGHNHYMPSFVIQHHVDRRPKLTTFGSIGLDLITPSSVAGAFQRNQPHDDSTALTAGIVYDLGQIKWTLAGTYATTAVIGDTTEHFFYLRPSLLWYVPKRFTFNSKTQWIIGLGVRSTWGPDGYEFGISNRVRAEITFRQFMANMRERRNARASR